MKLGQAPTVTQPICVSMKKNQVSPTFCYIDTSTVCFEPKIGGEADFEGGMYIGSLNCPSILWFICLTACLLPTQRVLSPPVQR